MSIFRTDRRSTSVSISALSIGAAIALLGALAAPAKAQQVDASEAWRVACHADLKAFCAGVKGGHLKRQCLDTKLTQVSAPCRSSLDLRHQERAAAVTACAADTQKLCADQVQSTHTTIACLQLKVSQVGPDCSKALTTLATQSKTGVPAAK